MNTELIDLNGETLGMPLNILICKSQDVCPPLSLSLPQPFLSLGGIFLIIFLLWTVPKVHFACFVVSNCFAPNSNLFVVGLKV